jgi:glutamate decarboxylase
MLTTLGREGYRRVMEGAHNVARYMADKIAQMGPYRLVSEGNDLPVFAFGLAPEVENYTVFDVSDRLRQRGWLVPAYTFPENRQDLSVLRIVVRAGMSHEMADHLIEYLREQTEFLQSLDAPLPDQEDAKRTAFSHN